MFEVGLEIRLKNSREKLDANLGIINMWTIVDTKAVEITRGKNCKLERGPVSTETIYPGLPRTVLVYTWCPSIIIQNNLFNLKNVLVWTQNYIVPLPGTQLWGPSNKE